MKDSFGDHTTQQNMSDRVSPWTTLLAALICLISQGGPIQARTHFTFMDSHCGTVMKVDGGLVLSLTDAQKLPLNRDRDFTHCDLDLVAPKGKKLFAHFLQLGISPSVDHSDRLQIFDLTLNNTRLTPIMGLYGKVDRALSLFDHSGSQIKDYKSNSNHMKFDYLGKPTTQSPGFRILVTSFQDPSYGGGCPDRHYLCRQTWMCINNHVVCDGKPNCGKSDEDDEKGCDRYDTVTSLLAKYSLARDITVVVLLPLVIFITFVVAVFLFAQRHIKLKLTKQVPDVQFTPKNEQVRISETPDVFSPPSYDELGNRYDPPPAYRGLSSSIMNHYSGCPESENEARNSNTESRDNKKERMRETRPTFDSTSVVYVEKGSTRGEINNSQLESYRLHSEGRSEFDDDDEMKTKHRRKGDRGKVKGRRKGSSNPGVDQNALTFPSGLDYVKCQNSYVPFNDTEATSSSADLSCQGSSSPDISQDRESSTSAASTRQSSIEQDSSPKSFHDFIPLHTKQSNLDHTQISAHNC